MLEWDLGIQMGQYWWFGRLYWEGKYCNASLEIYFVKNCVAELTEIQI